MPKISQILASVTNVKKIKAANIAPLSLDETANFSVKVI
jgi:hypothetical protein